MTTLLEDLISLVDGISELGERVFSPRAPEGTQLPYVTVIPAFSLTPELQGDSKTMAWSGVVQVSLWEQEDQQDEGLLTLIVNAIDGYRPPSLKTMRLSVQGVSRIPDPEVDIIQMALTIVGPIVV